MGRKDSKKRFPKGKAADGLPLKTPEVRSGTASPSGPSVPGQQAPDRWRPWLLAGAVALLVARPLYPSETPAETGDGLPVVMLWLVLAVLWMLGLLGRRQWTFRFGLLDGVMVFLMVWTAGSAMMWARVSHARPAVNMLWEWVGLGLVFLLVRQWTAGQREIRAILAVMLALAVGLAGYGLFQCVYEFPRTRAIYYADPEKALREAGLAYPAGSPERIAFEKRLESREPIATFALTNSLAGFLTPWLVVGAGIGVLAGGWSSGWRTRGGLLVAGLLLAACLLLTKSRSAYLGLLAGLTGLGLWWRWWEVRGRRRLTTAEQAGVPQQPFPASRTVCLRAILAVVGILAVLGLMIAAAFYWGGLDIQVFTEAQKSLQYRWEYWQATWQIIRQHPVWGCGPGLFRYAYTRFKLPQASEEIADPHNFLLEVWSTAGTPAALAMLAMLALWAVQMGRLIRPVGLMTGVICPTSAGAEGGPVRATEQRGRLNEAGALGRAGPGQADHIPSSPPHSERPGKIVLGAAAGVAVGFWVGQWSAAPPSLYVLMIGLPLGGAALWTLWPWVQRGGHRGPCALAATSRLPTLSPRMPKDPGNDPAAGSACNFIPTMSSQADNCPGNDPAGSACNPTSANPYPTPRNPAETVGRTSANTGANPAPPARNPGSKISMPAGLPGANGSGTDFLPGVLAAAVGALLVHLLAAGGISFAGVSGSLWLLAALATVYPDYPSDPDSPAPSDRRSFLGWFARHGQAWLDWEHQVGWPGAIGGLVLTMAVFFACHQTAFSPVLQCRAILQEALRLASTDPVRAEKLLQKAALADPLSSAPAEWLSSLNFHQWQTQFSQRPHEPAAWLPRLKQFEQYAYLALELAPEDAPGWFVQGQRFLEIGNLLMGQSVPPSRQEARRVFQQALGCFQQAASLYPHHALYRARLAEAFAALDYQPGMIRQARAALWLDDQMPHVEKKLPETLRRQLTLMATSLRK